MRDLKQDLPIGTFKLKMRNIINPTTATPLTLPFEFESLKEDVYTVIEYHDTISGVTIASGTVTDVSVIGFPLVANLFVDYTIKLQAFELRAEERRSRQPPVPHELRRRARLHLQSHLRP
jgi:hypothetical protein